MEDLSLVCGRPNPVWLLASVALLSALAPGRARADAAPDSTATPLCRDPDASHTQIVFVHGGELWLVSRAGGAATRLTGDGGPKHSPRFSPDGTQIAYVGRHDALYVVGITGGLATRVTHQPGSTELCDWTARGTLLFASNAFAPVLAWRFRQLFEVSPRGGLPTRLPVFSAAEGSLADDARWLAYTPTESQLESRKRYRGGFAPDVWLFDLSTNRARRLTTWRGIDASPMWHGSTVCYLSDSGSVARLNLWSYDIRTHRRRQLTHFTTFDVRSPAMGPGANGEGEIAFSCGPDLFLLNPDGGEPRRVPVALPIETHTATLDVRRNIEAITPSPSADQLAIEARGDLWIVDIDSAAVSQRNLTATSGVRERDPSFSPDGRLIAYFSDATGEYELCIRPRVGAGAPTRLTDFRRGFCRSPMWSPDQRWIACFDQEGRIYVTSVAERRTMLIDRASPGTSPSLAWSPDSRAFVYARSSTAHPRNRSLWLHPMAGGASREITSGGGDDFAPAFDRRGDYLYWVRRGAGLEPVFDDRNYDDFVFPETEMILCAPLRPGLGPPWAPAPTRSAGVSPDSLRLDGVEARAISVTPAAGRYANLQVAVDGSLVYVSTPSHGEPTLQRLNFAAWRERRGPPRAETVVSGSGDARLSGDGGTLVVRRDTSVTCVSLKNERAAPRTVALRGLETTVDLEVERHQIFEDTWRLYRDFYYDSTMSGVDWRSMRRQYEPLVAGCGDRADLEFVLREMLGELGASHVAVVPPPDTTSSERIGMLGVDFALDRGAYRFAHIYDSGTSDLSARNPLQRPGVDVREGEYLLAVDGAALDTTSDPWAAFTGTAGRVVSLTVSARPRMDSTARVVRLVPREDDPYYRNRAWVEHNRLRVEDRGGGRIGYVYLPDTYDYGSREWARQLYPQLDRDALIVDVRWNEGGRRPDKLVQMLMALPSVESVQRGGARGRVPEFGHVGPKCVLINGTALSGGDGFPYWFRRAGMGPLIGTTTMGSFVGVSGVAPDLIDGGRCDPPHVGFRDEHGWVVEGRGVEPDLRVEDDPTLDVAGGDAQLDAAIAEMLRELAGKGHSARSGRVPGIRASGVGH